MNKSPKLPPFLPAFPIYIFSMFFGKNVSELYNNTCSVHGYEGCFDSDLIMELETFYRNLDYRMEKANIDIKSIVKKENSGYLSYLSDSSVTVFDETGDGMRGNKIRQGSRKGPGMFLPSNFINFTLLQHKFPMDFEGKILIRRKAPWFYSMAEAMQGVERTPLENPIENFENQFLVSSSPRTPLKQILSIDLQLSLLKFKDSYPLCDFYFAFTGILINKTGIHYIIRRADNEEKMGAFLMFCERFTNLVRDLLKIENLIE